MSDDPKNPEQKLAAAHKDFVQETVSNDEYFSDGEEAARIAALKKRKQIAYGAAAFFLVIAILVVYSCQPRKGSMMYGICHAFLEQIVDYPTTVQILYIEQFPRAVRLYFNQTDAFGQFTQDMVECVGDPKGTLRFSEVLLNRKRVDADKVEKFNQTVPAVVASEPDLTLPKPPPSSLRKLP